MHVRLSTPLPFDKTACPAAFAQMKISNSSVLSHCTTCDVTPKPKAKQLRQSAAVVSLMKASAGHASEKDIRAAGAYGTTTVKPRVIYEMQAQFRDQLDLFYKEKFAALPAHLDELREANPGSVVTLQVDDEGRFVSVFVMLAGVVECALRTGRGATSSDMGHLTNHIWDGVDAFGVYKTGSGRESPLWWYRGTGFESGDKWDYIGTQVESMPAAVEFYSKDLTHIGDRMKGMVKFLEHFPGMYEASIHDRTPSLPQCKTWCKFVCTRSPGTGLA